MQRAQSRVRERPLLRREVSRAEPTLIDVAAARAGTVGFALAVYGTTAANYVSLEARLPAVPNATAPPSRFSARLRQSCEVELMETWGMFLLLFTRSLMSRLAILVFKEESWSILGFLCRLDFPLEIDIFTLN